jgi:putative N-acetyltransferase (TIGR04045 family)
MDGHFTVRHAVFVEEQGIFSGSDVDDRDFAPGTLHAVAATGELVVGAVRLYRTDDAGTWRGDRLAALVDHRRRGTLGARLVRFAVATAGQLGGTRMDALIQMPNVRFFSALGWAPCGELAVFHGVPHQPMDIPLSRVP